MIAAVLRESAAVSVSATQNFVAGLRAFLRFCFIEGCVPGDLSQAALPVTGRRRSSLPRGISKADAKSLLASCDRRFAIGRRDYAVLVTLLRLGLRRGVEVAALRLEDIDWRNGELVVRGKGSRLDRLPLRRTVRLRDTRPEMHHQPRLTRQIVNPEQINVGQSHQNLAHSDRVGFHRGPPGRLSLLETDTGRAPVPSPETTRSQTPRTHPTAPANPKHPFAPTIVAIVLWVFFAVIFYMVGGY